MAKKKNKDIDYQVGVVTFKCSCGATFPINNTTITSEEMKNYHLDVCSNCHPFYTGQQKIVDSVGKVEKFLAREKKAQNN